MAKAISVVNDARYDLRDYGTGVNIENVEITNYLNRVIRTFGRELCRMNADYTQASTSTSTSASKAYITAPTRANNIRTCWIGQDKLTQVSPDRMDELRKWYDVSSAQAKPQYWCLRGANIEFQQQAGVDASSSAWVVKVHYNVLPATITSLNSTSMPWGSVYNDHITQALVFYCRAKKDDVMENTDQAIGKMARNAAINETIRRGFVRKAYKIDW